MLRKTAFWRSARTICVYGLVGSLVGLIANLCYMRISYVYFYDTLRLWLYDSGSARILVAGAGFGGMAGAGLGFMASFLEKDDMPIRQRIMMLIKAFPICFGISLAAGAFAFFCALLWPDTYSKVFLLERFGVNDRGNRAAFAFVGGSIWGWGGAAIFYAGELRRLYRARRILLDAPSEDDGSWPPSPTA